MVKKQRACYIDMMRERIWTKKQHATISVRRAAVEREYVGASG